MSMKRSKQQQHYTSRGGRGGEEGSGKRTAREKAHALNWQELVQGQPEESFVPYVMSSTYTKGLFIAHATFGKGQVTAVEGSRIEVLFESGTKKLVHGIRSQGAQGGGSGAPGA